MMRRRKSWRSWLTRIGHDPRLFLAILPVTFPLMIVTQPLEPVAASPAPLAIPIRYALLDAPPDPLPPHPVFLRVERGDTLASMFQRGGLSGTDAHNLATEFSRTTDPRRLTPGHVVRFAYESDGTVREVGLKIGGWGEILASKRGDSFEVTSIEAPRWSEEIRVDGRVQTSLFEAIQDAGESPALVQNLVDVFQWDVDFFRLRSGDSFHAIVTKRYAGTEFVGYGPIVAARFVHRGEAYEAFHYQGKSGSSGYYARNGAPLRKQFLKAPLKFSRVTSRFTKRRFHPILKVFRPHHGVDYGAPTGAPVMATADGTVAVAGRGRGEGNFVRLNHSGRIQTNYLHLSRFARGIRPGVRVRQGQVIGYVGSTGLSTAPHLDYRVSISGKWVDPLKLVSVAPEPLRGAELGQFRETASGLAAKLATDEALVASSESSR